MDFTLVGEFFINKKQINTNKQDAKMSVKKIIFFPEFVKFCKKSRHCNFQKSQFFILININ